MHGHWETVGGTGGVGESLLRGITISLVRWLFIVGLHEHFAQVSAQSKALKF